MTPIQLAETILDHAESVPWPVTAFLVESRHRKSWSVETFRVNDPACDRLRKSRGVLEVGTYTKGAAQTDVLADVLEVMGRAR